MILLLLALPPLLLFWLLLLFSLLEYTCSHLALPTLGVAQACAANARAMPCPHRLSLPLVIPTGGGKITFSTRVERDPLGWGLELWGKEGRGKERERERERVRVCEGVVRMWILGSLSSGCLCSSRRRSLGSALLEGAFLLPLRSRGTSSPA